MKKDIAEASHAFVKEYEEIVGPLKTRHSALMAGVLATDAMTAENIQFEYENGESNRLLIEDIIQELPRTYLNNFDTTDPEQARNIQGCVIWASDGQHSFTSNEHISKNNGYRHAQYLIGSRSITPDAANSPDMELLLANADGFDRSVTIWRTTSWTKWYTPMLYDMRRTRFVNYTTEEVESMYNPEAQKYQVNEHTNGSIIGQPAVHVGAKERFAARLLHRQAPQLTSLDGYPLTLDGTGQTHSEARIPNRILPLGQERELVSNYFKKAQISDEFLDKYDVITHLSELAETFQLLPYLAQQIKARTVE